MGANDLIIDNAYGHGKRLRWIISNISRSDSIVEFGCGTGYMITLPLAKMGYKVMGVDLDEKSIAYGKRLFVKEGLDPELLQVTDVSNLSVKPDVIIASESLEHIPDEHMGDVFRAFRKILADNGKLLVTVPNGYGAFEMESFLWYKARLGLLLQKLYVAQAINTLRRLVFGRQFEPPFLSTLAESPHVQRFTFDSIQELLAKEGFDILSITGSTLVAGPWSNMFFTGIRPIMDLNCALGSKYPSVAAGFYLVGKPHS